MSDDVTRSELLRHSTEELVRRAQAGDGVALDELFSRAARLARARAVHLLGDRDAADDVAQEALVAACEGLRAVRRPEGFLGWLRQIVDRTAARHLAASVGPARHLPLHPDVPSLDPTPAEVVERREAVDVARRALSSLPPRSRLVVEMFYFDGLTCAEVAEFLDVSTDSVKATLHRSRERLRRSVTAVTTSPEGTYSKWYMMVTGDATFAGPLFEHDSEVSKLYTCLYPVGDPAEAARRAGLEPKRVPELLDFLEVRGLVTADGGQLRCTMPIVSDLDLEILRPWIDRTAGAVTGRLDDLAAEARTIADALPTGSARSTAMAVALFADPITRPLVAIHDVMEASASDRGEFGRFSAAVCVADEMPKGFDGGFRSEWVESPYGRCYVIYLQPHGTDRSAVKRFLEQHPGAARLDGPAPSLSGFLPSLEAAPVGRDGIQPRLAEFGIRDDAGAFAADLIKAGGAWWDGDRLRCGATVDHIPRWEAYWDRFGPIGEAVIERLGEGASDLRRRIARCSFSGCDFADAVTGCVMLVRGTIGAEVRRRGLAETPPAADLSWGYMIVR